MLHSSLAGDRCYQPSVLSSRKHLQEKIHPKPSLPAEQGPFRLSASCHEKMSSSVPAAEWEDLAGEPRRWQQITALR